MKRLSLLIAAFSAILPTVAVAAEKVAPSIYPEPSSTVSVIPEVRINFEGASDTTVFCNPYKTITLSNGEVSHKGDVYGWGANRFVVFADGADLTEEGVWTLTVPEGAFSVDGQQSAAVTAVFTIDN